MVADRQTEISSEVEMSALINPSRLIEVAPDVLLTADIAARYRTWRRVGTSRKGHQLFHVHDSHLDSIVFVRLVSRQKSCNADEESEEEEWHTREDIKCLQFLKHPRVAPFHQAVFTPAWILCVSPLVTGGTLLDVIEGRIARSKSASTDSQAPVLTEANVASVIRCVVEGLAFMHGEGLRYGCVHPEDLLFPSIEQNTNVFSAARLSCPRGIASVNENGQRCTFRSAANPLHSFGSIAYLSPEEAVTTFGGDDAQADIFHIARRSGSEHTESSLCLNSVVGTASDMWSVGVMAFYLLSGHHLFSGFDGNSPFLDLKKIVRTGFTLDDATSVEPFVWPPAELRPEALRRLPDAERVFKEAIVAQGSPFACALDFIAKCLESDPRERITASRALQHVWLSGDVEQQGRVLDTISVPLLLKSRLQQQTKSASKPDVLARNRPVLLSYAALCNKAVIKPNASLLQQWSLQGMKWLRRLDLSGANYCGPFGTATVIEAVCSLPNSLSTSFLIEEMILDDNNVTDVSIGFCVESMLKSLPRWSRLRLLSLRNNKALTHEGGRELLRLATRMYHDQCRIQREMELSGDIVKCSARKSHAVGERRARRNEATAPKKPLPYCLALIDVNGCHVSTELQRSIADMLLTLQAPNPQAKAFP